MKLWARADRHHGRFVPALTRMVGGELVVLALGLLLAAELIAKHTLTLVRPIGLPHRDPPRLSSVVSENDWSSQAAVFFGHPREGARQLRMARVVSRSTK